VILGSQEAEIRRFTRPYLKNKTTTKNLHKKGLVEWLKV
jgi:hypothetical protein